MESCQGTRSWNEAERIENLKRKGQGNGCKFEPTCCQD